MERGGAPGRMDRRRFLAALAAGTTGGLGAFGAVACGRQPDATARAPLDRVGLQLYTVRGLMAQDAAATLRAVADIGYGEVETAGLFDLEPSRFRDALDAAGLVSPAAHVSIDALRAEPAAVLASAHALGQTWLVVPWIAAAERTPEGYRRFAADLNAFGRAAREDGLRAAYHNHDFEFEPLVEGRTGYDLLLAETDPALVDMELDLFWTVKGGRDPVALFEADPGRFPLWHVKDMRDPAGAQAMVDVGAGDIDFARILAHAGTAGLRHAFVEHDNPADPMESIRTGYTHLRRLMG
jgi:sugar phosphate isomerase/epimerase